jgi:hypothetical protein
MGCATIWALYYFITLSPVRKGCFEGFYVPVHYGGGVVGAVALEPHDGAVHDGVEDGQQDRHHDQQVPGVDFY